MNNLIPVLRRMVNEIIDIHYAREGMRSLLPFMKSFLQYQKKSRNSLKTAHLYPKLHDRTKISFVDYHYFYANAWVARRLVHEKPERHVDVGSQINLINQLSACFPVMYVEYRPLMVRLDNLSNLAGDILTLPFGDKSISSLSSIHVVEHIGLGRYGDPVNVRGTELALLELQRILSPDGDLFLAVPVGSPGVYFNAHRVLDPLYIPDLLNGLALVEFSCVDDHGIFHDHTSPSNFINNNYACGLYWFKRG